MGDTPTEFIEVMNISDETLDLTGVSFSRGIDFTFPEATLLTPGERILVVQDVTAFEITYGLGLPIAGSFANDTRLANAGERLTLRARDDAILVDFRIGDLHPWPEAPDGTGRSLVLIDPHHAIPDSPLHWRSSIHPGGSPGDSDTISFEGGGGQALLDYALAGNRLPGVGILEGVAVVDFQVRTAADQAVVWVDYSTDLRNWTPAAATDFIARADYADGTFLYRFAMPANQPPGHYFARLRVDRR